MISSKYFREHGQTRTQPWFISDSPPYTCPELSRNPGLEDKRFEAFSLPSRTGSIENPVRIYPVRNHKTQTLIEWKTS